MNTPAKSVFAFGLWAIISGLGLLLIPSLILGLFGLDVAEPIYVRVIGFILVEIGLLYLFIARNNIQTAFLFTVYVRLIPVTLLTIFVVSGMGPWQLILFAIVDGLSAAHTWISLKRA